ncbi:hypothetical protein KGQ20_01860 [Catenulispora sp. NF23]|uniref:hypothetical protein n=1 Tax=Catenulispora pinistramenti TaxID=2705254 RepID=UPI001BA5C250|nr:hypothetical protein [Catenulispora pinistramenti]MBS2531509.1 hypothetical protein [Catenulispora pinistramenti]
MAAAVAAKQLRPANRDILSGISGLCRNAVRGEQGDVIALIPAEGVRSVRDSVEGFVETVRPFAQAGFAEVALAQVGGDTRQPFLAWAEKSLIPARHDL